MRRKRAAARLGTALVAVTPAVVLALAGLSPRWESRAPVWRVPAVDGPLLQTFALTSRAPAVDGMSLVAAWVGRTASLAPRETAPFSMVGVTWTDPRAVVDGAVEVRTRSGGRWTSWQALEADEPDAARAPGDRGASDPLWVGPSDAVQARVVGAAGERALPGGLRVDLINPEARVVEPAAFAEPPDGDREEKTPAIPVRPVPSMQTRAGWRADEAIVKGKPVYTGPVQVFFVHHTAGTNRYTCGQSASIVRGIEAYQVKSRGWDDIGYNFLVDKCGTVFEGRKGGVHRSVKGAHTLGFNDDASAVAVLGDYRTATLTPAARWSVAQLAAYKLGAAGNTPAGKVTLVSGGGPKFSAGKRVTLYRISGHRDAGATECPGNALYAQLPAIRALAGAAPAGLRFERLGGASAYAGQYYTKGAVQALWDLTTPSRMINRFDVFVDGKYTGAVANGYRLSRLSLPAGEHTIAVRALHLSGRTATISARLVADPVPPSFAVLPQVALTAGTVGGTAPIRLTWEAKDPSGLRAVSVTGPSTADLTAAARDMPGTATVSRANSWTVLVADHAGNLRSAEVTRTPDVLTETMAKRSGTWRTLVDRNHLDRSAFLATGASASLSWTFTGRSAGLIVGRTPESGRIKVFLDGAFQGYADLRSPTTKYRQIVWTRQFPSTGEHTVKIQVEGTAQRPGVIVDGLAYLH
ncbi:N-acetylmuramoyl-L-alanine amidase [Actinoplanes sp. NPDC051851]|uniref:N-acetylmuramoyl-L-alanine amidase n=1 Tax=Actinoplanes sp. NPDC051851 TaxID=3154753 RepID=UPI0034123E3B